MGWLSGHGMPAACTKSWARRRGYNAAMGHARFHVDRVVAGTVRLSEDESRHAQGSRRLAVGDELAVFDGAGREAWGRIVRCGRDGVEVELEGVQFRERPTPALTLAVAIPKGPRQDTMIEKCTELGVAALVPLDTERSVSSTSEHRLGKWRRTAIEAAKQSGQSWIPELRPPASLDEVLASVAEFDAVLVADASGGPWPETGVFRRVLAFVGPEGGWSEAERRRLLAAGARPVSLGPNILRIETAAMALAALVHVVQTGSASQGAATPARAESGSEVSD